MFTHEEQKKLRVINLIKVTMIATLSLMVFGVFQLVNAQSKPEKPVLVEMDNLPQGNIVVEISGAVKYPGVYRIKDGGRVIDLIKKAGGITAQADILKIAQELNMANLLEDEDRIFVSFMRDETKSELASDSKISLNSASQKELEELTGIGEKRASEIILQRPYQSIEELLDNEVVSEAIWQNIKNDIKL